jgi:peptidoglycan/xylan/chitin deacetylase (PgdA/CDA1 family)
MARRDVLVLCYHGVAPGSLHGEITPDALHAQLKHLAACGYRWTTFTDAVLGSEPERVAAITFDDGIASAVEHGLPILDDFGAPGTMFLTLEMLGWGGRLDAAGAARLAERGWEIGSHTMTHPVLTNVDDETLESELRESKRELEGVAGRP